MKYFSIFLVLICLNQLNAQDSGVKVINGTFHNLGVFYFQSLDGSDEGVISGNSSGKELLGNNKVRDTFAFVNNGKDTLELKFNRYDPEFKIISRVAPGDTGFVFFEQSFISKRNNAWLRCDSAIILNKKKDFLKVKLEYIIAFTDLQSLTEKITVKKTIVFPDNGGREKLLRLHANGKQKAWGEIYKTSKQKLGKWKYWDKTGGPLTDSIFSNELIFSIIGYSNYKNLKFQVKQNKKWKPAMFASTEERYSFTYSVYFFPGMDSLRISSDSFSSTTALKYSLITTKQYIDPIYLMSPGQVFINMRGHKKPLNFVNNEYALFVKRMKDAELPLYLEELKRKFPEISFSYNKKTNIVWLADMRNIKLHSDTFYLRMLKQESKIKYISKLFQDDNHNSSYFYEVLVKLKPSYNKDSLNSVLKQHPFKYSHEELSGLLAITYTPDKLLDKNYILAINNLYKEDCIEWIYVESVEVRWTGE